MGGIALIRETSDDNSIVSPPEDESRRVDEGEGPLLGLPKPLTGGTTPRAQLISTIPGLESPLESVPRNTTERPVPPPRTHKRFQMVVGQPHGLDGGCIVPANGTRGRLRGLEENTTVSTMASTREEKTKKRGKRGVIRMSQYVTQIPKFARSKLNRERMEPERPG